MIFQYLLQFELSDKIVALILDNASNNNLDVEYLCSSSQLPLCCGNNSCKVLVQP